MNNKGNALIVLLTIAGGAAVVVFSIFLLSNIPLACRQRGDCIILPFLFRNTVPVLSPIPRPVVVSTPVIYFADCRYYDIDLIKFSWEVPEGVDGVEYGLFSGSDYEFSGASKGIASNASYDLKLSEDGPTTFAVRFSSGGKWGPAAAFYFRLDRTAPRPFDITRLDKDFRNARPVFAWKTSDEPSGLAYYQAKIGTEEWFNPASLKRTDGTYILPEQLPAYSRSLTVRAYDFAGNFRESSVNFTVVPKSGFYSWLYGWPVMILAVVGVAIISIPSFAIYRMIKLRNRLEPDVKTLGEELQRRIEEGKKTGEVHNPKF